MSYTDILLTRNFTNLNDSIQAVNGVFNIGFSIITSSSSIPTLDYFSDIDYYGTNGPNEQNFQDITSAMPTIINTALPEILKQTGYSPNTFSVFFGDVSHIEFNAGGNNAIVIGAASGAGGTSPLVFQSNTIGGSTYGYLAEHEGAYGDIWFNVDWNNGWADASKGTVQFFAVLHELGHALGLGHPTSWGEEGTHKYTIMADDTNDTHPGMHSSVLPTGLQLYDIAAIQSIYGRNYDTRADDTTYSKITAFESTKPDGAFIYTIWDGKGTDTINASGYDDHVTIDLRQGEFSSIGKNGNGGSANDNVAIAYHAIIENATGTNDLGTGDILIGNDWENELRGLMGDDTLYGDGWVYDDDPGFSAVDGDNPDGYSPDSDDDILKGGQGADDAYGGYGNDEFRGEGTLDGLEGDYYHGGGFLGGWSLTNSEIDYNIDGRDKVVYGYYTDNNGQQVGGLGYGVTIEFNNPTKLHTAIAYKSENNNGTNDELISIEEFVLTEFEDTVKLGTVPLGYQTEFDGRGQGANEEDTLSFELRSVGVTVGNADDVEVKYENFEKILGSEHNDIFAYSSLNALGAGVTEATHNIDAKNGEDTVDFSDMTESLTIYSDTVEGKDIKYENIEKIIGSSSDDTFIIKDADLGKSLFLNGANGLNDTVDLSQLNQAQTIYTNQISGTDIEFSNVEKIIGGTGNDTFKLTDLDLLNGKMHLSGAGGSDILDLSSMSMGAVIDGNKIIGFTDGVFAFKTDITFDGFEVIIGTNQSDYIRNVHNMIIFTKDGSDEVEVGSNLYLLDASVDDRLTYFGTILDDGTQVGTESSGSSSPWTDWNSQGVRYGYNQDQDLVVQRLGGGEEPENLTYVANHTVDLLDSTNSTLGISVYELIFSAYRILEEKPDGWFSDTLKSLRVELEAALGDAYTPPATDPFVLDLSGNGFTFMPEVNTSPHFDLNADGFAERTAWTIGTDIGFLAVDTNNNGLIDDITELFGNSSQSGFSALSLHDSNADGIIDQTEATNSGIVIWVDQDGDAITDAGEFHTLSDFDITSINVTPDITTEDIYADYVLLQQGTFTYGNGSTGSSADVAFAINGYDSKWLTNITITTQAQALPNVKGHGTLPDLHAAMSYDPAFATIVDNSLSSFTAPDISSLRDAVMPILNGWVDSVGVPAGEPGTFSRIDVPILLQTAIGDNVNVLDFGVERSDEFGTYWELASGDDVLDEYGVVIERPTYNDIISQAAGNDEEWDVLTADQITFLERWTGEQMPFGMDHDVSPTTLDAMGSLLQMLWGEINAVAVRIASQGGTLASYFDGVEYDPTTELFVATSQENQLVPMFEAIFAAAPGTASGDQTHLDSWKGILDIVIEYFDQPGSASVTSYGFLFQNLVAAYENNPLAISIADAALTLDIPSDLLITGSGTLTGSTDADIFYMDGMDQTVNGDNGPDTFVFGQSIGHDIISELDGTGTDHTDVIRFSAHTASDLLFTRNGVDLHIEVIATGETITVEKQFEGRGSGLGGGEIGPAYGIKEIVFADNSYFDTVDIAYAVSHPTVLSEDIIGTEVTDVLDGSAGNERLEGLGGGDIYKFGLGDGHDTIYDLIRDPYATTPDVIQFKEGITFDDLTFSRAAHSDDLNITVGTGGDQITIEKQFARYYGNILGNDDWYNKIEGFTFTNETSFTWEDIIQFMPVNQSSDGDDSIYGFDYDDTLDGGLGNDYLSGGNDSDTYIFGLGYGNDTVYDYYTQAGSNSEDTVLFLPDVDPATVTLSRIDNSDDVTFTLSDGSTLTIEDQLKDFSVGGEMMAIENFQFQDAANTLWSKEDVKDLVLQNASTSGDDIIYGYNGSGDVLNGGTGNDTLYGLNGGDTYQFGIGSGNDTAQDLSQAYSAGIDAVEFLGSLTDQDVTFTRDGSDLLIAITGHTDTLRVENQFDSNTHYRVEEYRFSNNVTLDYAQVYTLATQGSVIEGDANDNILNATDGDDTIYGFEGNDELYGGLGNDTLIGGAGYDYLDGGSGSNTFVFNQNEGIDFIERQQTGYNSDIIFADGILASDISITRTEVDRYDVTLQILNSNNTVTIEDFNSKNGSWLYLIDTVTFSDTTTWNAEFIRDKYVADNTTSGNDTLIGFESAEEFIVSNGDDYIAGYGGNDIYHWASGAGNDTIYDLTLNANNGGNDTLIFDDLNVSDLDFSQNGDDLVITNITTNETLTVIKQLHASSPYHIENFQFANNTILDKDDVYALAVPPSSGNEIHGTTGNDTIYGDVNGIADDVIIGHEGNDVLRGKSGNDTYVWSVGDGNDTIYDDDGTDQILVHNTTANDIWFERGNAYDLTIHIGSETITIDDQYKADYASNTSYENERVETLILDDNTTYNLLANMTFTGTSANNTIYGLKDNSDDTIYGLDGADNLYGYSGNDTLIGGADNDTLRGDVGNDTYVWSVGDGNDTIYDDGGTDQILVHNTTANDIWFERGNVYDLTIHIGSETITIDDQYKADYAANASYENERVETLILDDNTTYNLLANMTFTGTSANNTIYGLKDNSDDTIYGLDGEDKLYGYAGSDVLYGGAGSDYLYGGDNDDILHGGSGVDMLYGQAGADTFVFDDVTASDNIQDFSLADGDKLDVSDLLTGYDPLTDAISDFVQITESGPHSYLSVDADGGGDNFVQVAYIYNETGLTDEDALESSGNLITV